MLIKFLKSLERWQYDHPPNFWFSVLSIYFCLITLFNHLSNPISSANNYYESLIVIEQLRCGASDKPYSDRQQQKVTNSLDDRAKREYLQKMLVKHFPDFESRVSLEKRQGRNYQKAVTKIKKYKRISQNYQKLLTDEEKSAIDYFRGTGIYEKFQDPNTPPNIYDTRKTFLKKMGNKEMREKFLEAYNRKHSIE